jgi:hypothetical protein
MACYNLCSGMSNSAAVQGFNVNELMNQHCKLSTMLSRNTHKTTLCIAELKKKNLARAHRNLSQWFSVTSFSVHSDLAEHSCENERQIYLS